MSRARLKRQIESILKGEDPDKQIRIYYTNPETGEVTELECFPASKDLRVEVDSPATAETFRRLREHKT